MYFRDAAELQLAPAGGSPPRGAARCSAAVAVCVAVTVGSFFFVAPLIDVAARGGVAALLARLGAGRSRARHGDELRDDAFSAKTHRQADERRGRRARRPARRPSADAGASGARARRTEQRRQGDRQSSGLQAARGVVTALEGGRRTRRGRDGRERDGGEQCVEGEPVQRRARRRTPLRATRMAGRRSTCHGHLDSLAVGRSFYARRVSDGRSPWRHSPGSGMRRSASTPTTASASTSTRGSAARPARRREGAGARRRDRGHARPRRPRRGRRRSAQKLGSR